MRGRRKTLIFFISKGLLYWGWMRSQCKCGAYIFLCFVQYDMHICSWHVWCTNVDTHTSFKEFNCSSFRISGCCLKLFCYVAFFSSTALMIIYAPLTFRIRCCKLIYLISWLIYLISWLLSSLLFQYLILSCPQAKNLHNISTECITFHAAHR